MQAIRLDTDLLQRAWHAARVPIISLFVLFHTAALVLWITPPFPLYWSILPLVQPYVRYFGFWNQWQMFAHPKTWTMYLTANVTVADGRVIVWNFPRMEKMDYVERAVKGHYREWAHEYVNEDAYPLVRPEACIFIARDVHNATTQPVSVQLVRHWTWIQPPPGFGEKRPEGEFEYVFFTYDVKPVDLK